MEKKEMEKLLGKFESRIVKRFDDRTQMISEHFEHQLSVIAETQTEHTMQLKKLDNIQDMVAQNTVDIDIMKSMLRRKVDIDEFGILEKRVMVLEKKMRVG